jgi:Fe-S cluster biogenesis protein NfuA
MLAQKIIGLDGVTGVFYGYDFVSVTKEDGAEWDGLKTRIMAAIMDHYMTGFPLFREGMDPQDKATANEDDDELTAQIKELLETRVRPMVAMDGGDIVFDRFEDGIVYLEMRGACSGCPSSTMTLKSGIENMLRHYVPEVLEVRPSNES